MEGIKNYGRYYELNFDDIFQIKIDLNKSHRNEYIIMNLLNTGGTINPLDCSLIYSNRSNQSNVDFGNKIKLSSYKKVSASSSTQIKITNPDDSVDTYTYNSNLSKYENKEKHLTATVVKDDYSNITSVALLTLDGCEMDLDVNKNYPTLISKGSKQTNFTLSNGVLSNVNNQAYDVIEYSLSSSISKTITWKKNGYVNRLITLNYDSGENLTGVIIKNIDNQILYNYTLSLTSNYLEIINNITSRRVKVTITSESTNVKVALSSSYENAIEENIHYLSDSLTLVEDSLQRKTKYVYSSYSKCICQIDESNYGVVTKYDGYKLVKESKPINLLTNNTSLIKNGHFGFNNTSYWTVKGTSLLVDNTNSNFSFCNKLIKINQGGSIEQTIVHKGTYLDNYTLSFVHGNLQSAAYYNLSVTITTYDENNALLEEKSETLTDFNSYVGLTLDAIRFKPTKSFAKMRVKVYSYGLYGCIGYFTLNDKQEVTEYKYDSEDQLCQILDSQVQSVTINDNGEIEAGKVNNQFIDKEYDGNKEISYSPLDIKTEITKDDYERVISKKISSDGKSFVSTITYEQDEVIEESNGIVSKHYSYTTQEKNPLSITDEEGNTTSFEYNNRSLLSKMSSSNNDVSYTYSSKDELKTFKNYENSYDGYSNLTSVKLNNHLIASYEYNSDNSLKKETYPDYFVSYTYDKGKVTNINKNNQSNASYTYDDNERVTSIIDGNTHIDYEYDSNDHLIKETFVHGENDESIERVYEDNKLLSTIKSVQTTSLISKYTQASNYANLNYYYFKESMYRYPTSINGTEVSYDTYCCFFDKVKEGLINISLDENKKEIKKVINPITTLPINHEAGNYNYVQLSGTSNSILVYNLPKYERIENKIDCSVSFEFKKNNSNGTGTIMYIGPKHTKKGAFIIKCITINNVAKLRVFMANVNEYPISEFTLDIDPTGWNKVSFGFKKFKSCNVFNLYFTVNGQALSYLQLDYTNYDADNALTIGENAHLCFGASKVNSVITDTLQAKLANIILTMHEGETEVNFREEQFKELQELQSKYQSYKENLIDGIGVKQSSFKMFKTPYADRKRYDIYSFDKSFVSNMGTKPIYLPEENLLLEDDTFIYNKEKEVYEYNAKGKKVSYLLSGSSKSVSINCNITESTDQKTILSLVFEDTIIDFYVKSNVLSYRKKTNSTNYQSTTLGNISSYGENRLTVSYAPSGTQTTFNVFLNETKLTSFTISGLMVSSCELIIGLDKEGQNPLNSTISNMIISNYSISNVSKLHTALDNAKPKITINRIYDKFDRIVRDKTQYNETVVIQKDYTYKTYSNYLSNQLLNEKINIGYEDRFTYSFTNGSKNSSLVRSVTYNPYMESSKSTQYIYDSNNRLIREVTNGSVTNYTYDSRGNILTKGSNSFTYGSSYLDRLEEINGVSVSYDSTNPYKMLGFGTSISGLSFIYSGKDITSITNKATGVATSFTYDSFGRRTSKGNTSYVYLDGKLEAEITSSYTLRFLYDENDNLFGFYYNDTPYFYLKNALGIIYGIVDQNKNKVVEYSYDAWGKLLSTTSSNTTISNINPFIYKSYYYDKETGLYWLSSRYYNPDWGRFISPDSIDYLEIESINGLNLFAYCGNDPIMYVDPTGHFSLPNWAKWVIGGVAFVGAVALTYLTGGALAPVFIGMAGSILLDGVVEGAVSSANGRDFWEGFADGAANGAMLGGIFALGGAALRTIKMFKNGVAIGENMKRVNNLAKAGHQITYKGMPGFKFVKMFGGDDLARTLSMRHNQAFIERMMKWGIKIVDFGIDSSRNYRSFYYLMETIVSNGYRFLQLMY